VASDAVPGTLIAFRIVQSGATAGQLMPAGGRIVVLGAPSAVAATN
jgi:hypothetical protein